MREIVVTFVLLLGLPVIAFAGKISYFESEYAAKKFIDSEKKLKSYRIADCNFITKSGDTLAYAFDLSPKGYIVISAYSDLPPVIAFSVESNFGELNSENPLLALITVDLSLQLNCGQRYAEANNAKWEELFSGRSNKGEPEQWPAGQEGWITSSWNQNAPFWNMCPIDPVTHSRCYTGCPATAMAMVLNFHGTTNNVQFSNDDDYYHNYAGRNYWIDDDFGAIGFPSFPDLNKYLDTLNLHYQQKSNITNNDKAALSFACGVAAHQVYTSQGSGTFAVSQAYDAYIRFGCATSVLMYPEEPGIFDSIILNMQNAMPVHLAVVDESNSSGHNLVVDGYRSDNYYHLDYGYGEYYNGWYLIPSEIQMDLTVIEGVIVNIMKQNTSEVEISKSDLFEVKAYPVPTGENITLEYSLKNPAISTISLLNATGVEVYNTNLGWSSAGRHTVQINTDSFTNGIYFYVLTTGSTIITGRITITH